jgi:hypothetical protein
MAGAETCRGEPMCGRPAKFGCVDFWLTARHSVAVHTLNYLHAQLQVHTLDYRELSAHSGTRVSALDFTNVAMGPAGRREPGEHDGDSSAQSTARRDRMCDRHSRAEQLRLHTGPRGAGRAPRAQQRLFGPGRTTAHHWEAALAANASPPTTASPRRLPGRCALASRIHPADKSSGVTSRRSAG